MTEDFKKARDEYLGPEPKHNVEKHIAWKSAKYGADWAYDWLQGGHFDQIGKINQLEQKLAIAVEALEYVYQTNTTMGIEMQVHKALSKIRGEK